MPQDQGVNLLLVGASVRGAASSARRANLCPWGADLFADADLSFSSSSFTRVVKYPWSFMELAAQGPPGPWLYTGALENWPNLVEKMARRRPLWGNPAEVLRRVRSPRAVVEALHQAGWPCPAIHEDPNSPPAPGQWLRKPRRGAGGCNIIFYLSSLSFSERAFFLQQYIAGDPVAALFCGTAPRAIFLGATRQLVGEPWLHARPFQYCGSIGPLPLSAGQRQTFETLGQILTQAFGLQGLFGVDGVLREGRPWPVEVNPRYSASVEIVELAQGMAALALHGRVFDPELPMPPPGPGLVGLIGKGILFARRALVFPQDGPWLSSLQACAEPWTLPRFADIPHSGHRLAAGQPILSFFVQGKSVSDCREKLRTVARDLDHHLFAR